MTVSTMVRKLSGGGLYTRSTVTLMVRGMAMISLLALHVLLGQSLGSHEYGYYTYAISLAGVLTSVSALGLPTAMMRFIGQYAIHNSEERLKGVLLQLPGLSLLTSCCVSAVLWFFVAPWLDASACAGVRAAALLLPLFVLEQVRRCLFKAYSRPIGSILPDELICPLLLITVLLLIGLRSGLEALIYYAAITFTLAGLFLLPLLVQTFRTMANVIPSFDTSNWIRTGLPMALGGIGYLLMSRTDIIMLGSMTDMHVTGVYAAANRVAMLSQIVLSTTAIIAVPMITRTWHSEHPDELRSVLRQMQLWILALTLPVLLVTLIFAGPLLGLFGTEYMEGITVLRVLAVGQFVNAVAGPVGLVLSMIGKQNQLALIMSVGALCNIVANAIVIPSFGGLGAAIASAVCFSLLNLGLVWCVTVSLRANSETETIA